MSTDGKWTPDRLRMLIAKEGLTVEEFSSRHHLIRETVYKWLRGQGPGPGYSRVLDEIEAKVRDRGKD